MQSVYAVPKDLDTDTNEQERGEPQNNAHAAFADDRGETVGETVANINTQCHERRADDGGENCEKIRAEMMRLVRAKCDGHGNGAWSDSERESEGVKSAAKNIVEIHF